VLVLSDADCVRFRLSEFMAIAGIKPLFTIREVALVLRDSHRACFPPTQSCVVAGSETVSTVGDIALAFVSME
jgi:hypothetical protein